MREFARVGGRRLLPRREPPALLVIAAIGVLRVLCPILFGRFSYRAREPALDVVMRAHHLDGRGPVEMILSGVSLDDLVRPLRQRLLDDGIGLVALRRGDRLLRA